MGQRKVVLVAFVVVALSVAAAPQAPATSLTPKQQKVVDYLVSHWGKDMNVSGVSLAMRIVGGDYTGHDRYAIGTYLKDYPELHRVLRTFGWETVTLDPHEKRIARVLSRAEREQRPAPSPGELRKLLHETRGAVESGLRMLEWFGIIRPDPSAGGIGYRMAEERYVDWEGAMRITFMNHRVEVEGLDPFDVF
jgi:hypothetical protein